MTDKLLAYKSISVISLAYIGLPIAIMCSSHGVNIIGPDKRPEADVSLVEMMSLEGKATLKNIAEDTILQYEMFGKASQVENVICQ